MPATTSTSRFSRRAGFQNGSPIGKRSWFILLDSQIAGSALPIAGLIGYLLLTRPCREDWLLVILGVQTFSYAAAASLWAFGPIWGLESAFGRTTLNSMPTLALVLGSRAEFLRRPSAPA